MALDLLAAVSGSIPSEMDFFLSRSGVDRVELGDENGDLVLAPA